ncbi:MAG: alpha/beta hydrolase family protein [Mangrovibacterium sp.]
MKRTFKLILFTGFLLAALPHSGSAQDPYRALNYSQSSSYPSFLMRKVYEQYKQREKELEQACLSREGIEAYCRKLKERYKSVVGEMPEAGDLHARVTGVTLQKGFRVEKVIFESSPHRYVTAILYMPEGKGKYPVTLELCGHGLNGKGTSPMAVLLARNGIGTFIVDPIGQGERWQYIDDQGAYATRGVTTEHTLTNAGCCVVGTTLASLQCFDNMRAVDYLLSREDVDPERIGCYGSSGGGTETSYLIAQDERIRVAAICSYFSQRARTFEVWGPSDGCQHIPYEGKARVDNADFVLMMAPKPVLILSGRYDFVDLWGARQGFEELKKAYTAFGKPEQVDMLEVETGHGMGKEKRNKLACWFKKYLAGDDSPLVDNEEMSLSRGATICTQSGQVSSEFKDAVSINEANMQQTREWASRRKKFMSAPRQEIIAGIHKLLGIQNSMAPLRAELTGKKTLRLYDEYRYMLIRDGEFPVAAVVLIPHRLNKTLNPVLVLDDRGKSTFLLSPENLNPYLNNGQIVVVADARGFGESEAPHAGEEAKYWNREYRTAMLSLHVGEPIVGQRVKDIISLADFITTDPVINSGKLNIMANGLYGPAVVHAAFLDKRIESASLSRSIKSYTEFNTRPLQYDMFSNVLYGVLKFYDLPDLVKSCKKISYKD